jgi:hypothetical protein
MPVPHVNVQNGSVTNGPLSDGCYFKWSNPTNTQANLGNCGGFCTASSFIVYANSTTDAQILANPTDYTFTDSAWNAPGQPHIVVQPWPTPKEKEHRKEVA